MNENRLTVEHRILRRQPLAPLTTLGVGGVAEYYISIETTAELAAACNWANRQHLLTWVLSGGSNLVVSDDGVPGLTIDIRIKGVSFEQSGESVSATVAAGENWDEFVAQTTARGHAGLECLSGIPGRVGATPIQNVGAYGQDVGQVITRLSAYDRLQNAVVTLDAGECDFSYRSSRFRDRDRGRFVILAVSFELRANGTTGARHAELSRWLGSEPTTPKDMRDAVLELRRSKSMVYDPADPWSRSCGSFFVNPVVPAVTADRIRLRSGIGQPPMYPMPGGLVKIAAAWLIERAGFARGFRDGAVGLSNKHTLAIVAHAHATASDICRFARRIQDGVLEQFEVELLPEPVFWGYDAFRRGLPQPA